MLRSFSSQEKINALQQLLDKYYSSVEVRKMLEALIKQLKDESVGIVDIKLTDSDGCSYITYTLSNGSSNTITVKHGEKGDKGDTGAQGQPGQKGDKGDKGPQGERGPLGLQGERGIVGPLGERGLKGDKGDRGEQGPTGPVGPVGPQGVKGTKGDRGERGLTGARGPKGDTGAKGTPGKDYSLTDADIAKIEIGVKDRMINYFEKDAGIKLIDLT